MSSKDSKTSSWSLTLNRKRHPTMTTKLCVQKNETYVKYLKIVTTYWYMFIGTTCTLHGSFAIRMCLYHYQH
jgi:hypothetical protein